MSKACPGTASFGAGWLHGVGEATLARYRGTGRSTYEEDDQTRRHRARHCARQTNKAWGQGGNGRRGCSQQSHPSPSTPCGHAESGQNTRSSAAAAHSMFTNEPAHQRRRKGLEVSRRRNNKWGWGVGVWGEGEETGSRVGRVGAGMQGRAPGGRGSAAVRPQVAAGRCLMPRNALSPPGYRVSHGRSDSRPTWGRMPLLQRAGRQAAQCTQETHFLWWRA